MTIVSDPNFEVDGPDEDPTKVVDHQSKKNRKSKRVNNNSNGNSNNKSNGNSSGNANKSNGSNGAKNGNVPADDEKPADNTPPFVVAGTETGAGATIADAPHSNGAGGNRVPQVASAQLGQPWSTRQLMSVAQRALLVFAVMGMIGYGLGAVRGSSYVARTEFVYTLDESVPDSFLREDRRLLTQVVTFKSDAVLTPVAEEFDLTVDELRGKIDVETLELSEVLRLDVSDSDSERAIAMSRAVLDRYLQVITDAAPAGDNEELAQSRAEVTEQLAAADASRRGLLEALQNDAVLEVQQNSIQRQINLKDQQINRIQGSLDDALVQQVSASRLTSLNEQFAEAQATLANLEADLAAVGSQRAALVTETTAEPALLREVERLEAKLTTIDDELADRELAPLVASPIRELSQPIVLFRSLHLFGLQGMALGLMTAIPVAAFVAYRARRQQLWFD
ncbi:MAG: hypothetical protein ACRBK7_27975 [Acidimicrobiales bacterium]